ncbi:MAG: threonine/serine exporter family protein [Treponema sp.]|nr:threonine/serine exporter family protein [Treponema sp.]
MTMIQLAAAGLWSFGASACCAVCFNAEKKDIILGAVLGAAGWVIYAAFKAGGGAEALGYFAGAFAAAGFSEFLAVLLHRPATVYLVPGIIPLVPGGGIFYMMRAVVKGEFPEALSAGYGALTAAVAIALGIAIASSTARIITAAVKRRPHKGEKIPDHPVYFPDDIGN